MPVLLGKVEMWSDHHIYKHHIDTGYPEYDPDTFCFKLYTKKTPKCSLHQLNRLFGLFLKCVYAFLIIVFPGIGLGQSLAKWIYWVPKNKDKVVWNWWEVFMFSFMFFCHIYRWNIFATILFYSG